MTWAVLVACSTSSSSSSSGQCNTNPWQCAAGQTCWPTDNNPTPDFGCITSNPGAKPGDPCHESPGAATCGDFMLCDQISANGGICALYCDSAHSCPSGYACAQLSAGQAGADGGGAAIQICRIPSDGGLPLGDDSGSGDDSPVIPSDAYLFDSPIHP